MFEMIAFFPSMEKKFSLHHYSYFQRLFCHVTNAKHCQHNAKHCVQNRRNQNKLNPSYVSKRWYQWNRRHRHIQSVYSILYTMIVRSLRQDTLQWQFTSFQLNGQKSERQRWTWEKRERERSFENWVRTKPSENRVKFDLLWFFGVANIPKESEILPYFMYVQWDKQKYFIYTRTHGSS